MILNDFLALFIGIARKLASSGYGVFAMDYPGFGLSEGLHGYVPSFDKLVDDVIEHYSKVKGMTPIDLFHKNFNNLYDEFVLGWFFSLLSYQNHCNN